MATLREQVEHLLPGWESWYPTLFDAAQDLGLIRARVAPLSSLLLSNRHAGVQNEAIQAFRRQWAVEDDPQGERPESPSGILRGGGSVADEADFDPGEAG